MAIGADDTILKFGTADTLGGSGSSIAVSDYSVAADLSEWTNDDRAPMASFLLSCGFALAPTLGDPLTLVAKLVEVEGTNDEPEVESSGNLAWHGHVLGGFTVRAATAVSYYVLGPVWLPAYSDDQKYQFYIHNGTGQEISANWNLKVKSVAFGPHA